MNTAGNAETEIIAQLSTSNDKTMAALKKIEAQVNTTNESAQQISEAVSIITSIAEETNLLSLNATIEAARAGEQGRGFAVVASQIQKLAEQSNQSAESIQKIIEHLLDESGKTVEVMKDVKSIATEQQQKLVETSEHGNMVVDGICKAKEKIENIGEYVTQCGEGKNKVSDIIEGLSSISEENAAACEETTASMQELNATMAMMEEASNKLNEVSDTLKSEIAYFRISSENTIKDVAGSIAE
jgi:methyl-accepting chemotaxis protein